MSLNQPTTSLNGKPYFLHKLPSPCINSCPTSSQNRPLLLANTRQPRRWTTNTCMMFSVQQEQPQGSPSQTDAARLLQTEHQATVVPAKFIATPDSFEKKGHSWFALSKIPTDLSIQVQDITFHVHKYPLISKCSYFGRVELQPPKSSLCSELLLDNFPGGLEAFEIILKFCYGLPISLNVNNVAALRCASEFLEMTEALEDGNLISKTESFFTFVVLSSWRDSITVLKSCKALSPWAENLQIVRRCCDSIAWKISQEISAAGEIMANRERWWFEDLTSLRIDYFTRIITALRAKGMKPELIGSCIMQYGDKWLLSKELEREAMGRSGYERSELQWNIMSGRRQEGNVELTKEQRLIVESLVSMLPPQKEAISCKFILKMLKMAIIYSASPALVSELEKRAGFVLEMADVNDLLIPSYTAGDQVKLVSCSEEETMHNVDVVQRILGYFLLYEQQQQQQQQPGPLAISKLVDSYLAEISRDPKLTVTKFLVLAQSLPENARTCDDGLYRAIDTFLKTHPLLAEHERRKLCKVMNCGKLSLDACEHAAQNDRLPVRTTIEVLFSEQMKIRAAMQGKGQREIVDNSDQESTNKEVKALKMELERVKMQMADVQRDYLELQQEYQKQNNNGSNSKAQRRNSVGWAMGWRKIRKSALFNGKMEGEEDTSAEGTHNRPNQDNNRPAFRRRQSIS